MQHFCTITAVIAFLLHAALGCCAHHEHAVEHHSSHDACVEEQGIAADEAAVSDADVHECDEPSCVYVSTAKFSFSPEPSLAVFIPAFATDSLREVSCGLNRNHDTMASDTRALPLRAYLYYGVLLI